MRFPATRSRRLRLQPRLRSLLQDTILTVNDHIYPLFIKEGTDLKVPIKSMPGQFQWSLDTLLTEIAEVYQLGMPGVMLFGIPSHKDEVGSASYEADGLIQTAIAMIKDRYPDLLVMADVCFCEYTPHGHCGVMENYRGEMHLHNDATLELLAKQAISFASAGADVLAPSGMIDGGVQAIRQALDAEGFHNIASLSHTIKFASNLYGPFRDAAESAAQYGDRKTYQADFATQQQALREVALDIAEGADILMVKPAGMYLDIIRRVRDLYPTMPLAAYQVSGEYAMIKAAAANGWLDEKAITLESLIAIKRAGSDFIVHYSAKEVVKWLQDHG